MAALTAAQQSWLQGFWAFFQGQARPMKVGPKRDGWDAAELCTNKDWGGDA
jgi:hypothetical protein